MSNNYLSDYVGIVGVKDGIGIEIELEYPTAAYPFENDYWYSVGEDSLRNGFEYVTKLGMTYSNLDKIVEAFDIPANFHPKSSIRTSTHFHFNAMEMSKEGFNNFLLNWYRIEDAFIETQHQFRHGNLFCLPLSVAEGIADGIDSMLQGQYSLPFDSFKYGALNLASVSNIGTVEFRFFDAISDQKLLRQTCQLMHTTVRNLQQIPYGEFDNMIKLSDPLVVLQDITGDKEYFEKRLGKYQLPYLLSKNEEILSTLSKIKGTTKYNFITPSDDIIGTIPYDFIEVTV